MAARRFARAVGAVATTVCVTATAACSSDVRPYDTPRARVDGEQAVALLRREVERTTPRRVFSEADTMETRTPAGAYAWLVRLAAADARGVLCGYVWRGEEAGRADGTVIRIQIDPRCRHWRR